MTYSIGIDSTNAAGIFTLLNANTYFVTAKLQAAVFPLRRALQ